MSQTNTQKLLGQYFTPVWAAIALIERHNSWLRAGDVVIEPTCGPGAFLEAMPEGVEVVGVEIDPALAQIARERTGRRVITGDFRTVCLDGIKPTCMVGNVPFNLEVFEGIMRRAHELLPNEGTAGFIVPAHFLQTASTVVRLSAQWSLTAELLPRTLFPNLSKPIVWANFRKGVRQTMVGLALFEEARDVEQMPAEVRKRLCEGGRSGSVWFDVCDLVLGQLGGEAHLDAIYASVEPRRPTLNPAWKEKVRQTMRRRFRNTGPGRYARDVLDTRVAA